MSHLAHPFDDAFFAALAGGMDIARTDLPTEYDPGGDWGNDNITTDLPGMPGFSFMCGDDGWHGVMAIYTDGFTYRRTTPEMAQVSFGIRLTETQMSSLINAPCGRMVEAPAISGWTVVDAQHDPDDPDSTILMLAVPVPEET